MALATYTLTGNIKAIIAGVNLATVAAFLESNLPDTDAIVDPADNSVHVGEVELSLDENGAFSRDGVIGTAAVEGLRYRVRVTFLSGQQGSRTVRSNYFEVVADTNLGVEWNQGSPVPITPSLLVEATTARDEAVAARVAAEAARDAAVDISNISTSDGVVTALVNDSGSTTAAALSAAIGGQIDAEVPALVTAGIAADGTVVAAASAAVGAAIYSERTTKNLYNPSDPDVLNDQVPNLGAPGTHTALANYRTSGFIPVTNALQYTIQNVRYYEWYDAAKVTRGAATNTGDPGATVTVTAPGDGYVRITNQYATNPNMQMELGSIATAYEPYFPGTIESVDPQFAASVAEAIVPYAGPLAVARVGNAVTITSDLNGSPLVRSVNLAGSNNGAFTMTAVTHGGASISTVTDDIAPIRTQLGAVGAGHGYTGCIAEFTNPDGKTNADLGSVWQDTAGREYVLLGFSTAGKLVMGGSYTSPGGVVTVAAVAPVTNLTHVSGATATGAIDYTTKATAQLFPSIGRVSVSLYVNGELVASDDTRNASDVEIVESYDVLGYGSLYDAAKANVGVSYATLPVAGCVRITNRFRYNAATCFISTSLTELQPTTLTGAIGSTQAVISAKSGATTTVYLPGVGTVGGKDWTAGVPMAGYASDISITTAGLTVAGQPPAFSLDVVDVSGTVAHGFAVGYLPFGKRGDEASRNPQRIARAAAGVWRIASFKKSYPAWTLSETTGWGRLTTEAFRTYLTPDQVAKVLASKSNALTAWDALGIA